ncbi:tektin-3-like [Condylostylus longicornis]|uniref:tektin-3-like n=1 Tax=Condylostylus longicornis TaxID=2530218 RepID=UPI00244E0F13|nr:tektin-3-like [Condylostylus longicornis]
MVVEKQNTIYSQLQPWSSAFAPPCVEPVSGPSVPKRVGISYQTTKPHPWRPTLTYELLEPNHLPEQSITNSLVNTCFMPTGMLTEPILFPNFVTGFERNPQNAARAALYTRYTQSEWSQNTASLYSASNSNRNNSERLRNQCIKLMTECDEKCAGGQRDSSRRLGERITDVTFWRNELNSELEKLMAEINTFSNVKQQVVKAIQDLETPLHIAQECLYHRETRKGQEKVHDDAEKALLLEIDNIRNQQSKLESLYSQIKKQLQNCRAAQFALEEDITRKDSALGIDSTCHQLNDFSRGINYYGGIEKYDPNITNTESWSISCGQRVHSSQQERSKTTQLRTDIEQIINSVANSIWDHWANTNIALSRRGQEIENAKNQILDHLHKVQKEIFDLQKYIDLILKTIQNKSVGLMVAQTRLEARSHREGNELCKDGAQIRLVDEVKDTQESVTKLDKFLQESEAQLQELLKTRNNLESSLAAKVNALFIDREKCLGMRKSFPMNILIKY